MRGAIGVEVEIVPEKIAAEVSKRLDILTIGMGAGSGCDAQYLFATLIFSVTIVVMCRDMRKFIEITSRNTIACTAMPLRRFGSLNRM